jgi:DNA-binding SARP family transcriptional activator
VEVAAAETVADESDPYRVQGHASDRTAVGFRQSPVEVQAAIYCPCMDRNGGADTGVRLWLLGEFRATAGDAAVDLGGPRQRAVLAMLALARGEVVSVDELIDAVWGDAPPAGATGSLQAFVSHLRRALQPDRAARSSAGVIVRESRGYALRLPPDGVDVWRFERLVRDGAAAVESDPAAAATKLTEALGLWRGTPLLDYRDEPWAQPHVARLTGLRTAALEHAFAARLESGEAAVLVPELQQLVDEDPLREERWRLLVLALYRANRQAAALSALRRAREVLADELGVDPGPALRSLEAEVLAQSPTLDVSPAPPPQPTPPAPGTTTPMVEQPTAVGAPADIPAPRHAADILVEREREVRELDAGISAAVEGDGRLVLLHGPPGIGKSRLLLELRTRAERRGLRVLRARGSELEQAFAFGAARQLFEGLLRERPELLTGGAVAAGVVFDPDHGGASDGEDVSFATLHGLYWLTLNSTADGPLLLIVDDLHWCDSGSLRFLGYLARRLDGLPVLLVGATRDGERYPSSDLVDDLANDAATVSLRPRRLSRDGVRALVRERLGLDAAADFCDACFDSTGGNPLALRQLLRALESEGVRPDVAHVDVARALGSRALSSIVLLRLRRLTPAATAVARSLAVLGDGAGLPVVAAHAGLPEADAARVTEELALAEIVRPEPPLGFVHALVRDAVYRDVSPGERELAHDRAARLLADTGAGAEHVAAQLLHAPRRADEWVVAALRRAAAEALHRGWPDGAAAYLKRALEEPPPADQRADILLDLGVAQAPSDGPGALVPLQEAYELLKGTERGAVAARTLAHVLVFAGPRGGAPAFAQRAAAELSADQLDEKQSLVALSRVAGHMHGLPPETWGFGDEPSVVGDGPGARMLEAELSWEWLCAARPAEEAARLAARSLADGQLYTVDNGLLWVVATFVQDMADKDVMPQWDRALAYVRDHGSLFGMLSVGLWRGFALWRRGELLEAEESLRMSIEQLKMWQSGIGDPYAEAFLIFTLLERDDVEAAQAVLDSGRAPTIDYDGTRALLEATAALRLAQGRPAEAMQLAEQAAAMFSYVVNPVWRLDKVIRGKALTALGRPEEAVALVERDLEIALRWGRRARSAGCGASWAGSAGRPVCRTSRRPSGCCGPPTRASSTARLSPRSARRCWRPAATRRSRCCRRPSRSRTRATARGCAGAPVMPSRPPAARPAAGGFRTGGADADRAPGRPAAGRGRRPPRRRAEALPDADRRRPLRHRPPVEAGQRPRRARRGRRDQAVGSRPAPAAAARPRLQAARKVVASATNDSPPRTPYEEEDLEHPEDA